MKSLRIHILFSILVLAGCLTALLPARAADNVRDDAPPAFVELQLNSPAPFSRLKPGDVLQGEAVENVFSGYRLMIPKGTLISVRVSGTERRRKESGIHWPWPARYFTSKYRTVPTFDQLTASLSGGVASFPVSVVTGYDEIHLAAQPTGAKTPQKKQGSLSADVREKNPRERGARLELVVKTLPQANTTAQTVAMNARSDGAAQPRIEPLAAGTETKLALLGGLSASRSRPGDPFKAVLAEPLRLSSGKIVPQGSLFEGHVRKSIAPRWLSRPGSLYLVFNRLVLPTGDSLPIAASVVGIETNRHSKMKVDAEGNLSGGRPGKKQLLADLGVGFAVSKVADDGFQLIAEALVSTATDASTAGTARLVGMAVGGLYFVKRRGRDVILPPYTMISIRFDRSPLLLSPEAQQQGVE